MYDTLLSIDRQFVEVFILLQRKFTPQIHIVPILVYFVNHHGVEVVKLQNNKCKYMDID